MRDIGLGDFGCLVPGYLDHLGDDLNERNAGTVVVDERVVRTMDAAGCTADMQRFSGVLLHMCALDLYAVLHLVDLDLSPALERDRLVILRRLKVLRLIRVEVVLARETAPLRDLAIEREADADCRLDGLGVDNRQGAGQA